MRWAGNVARMGAYRILVGKPEGMRSLRRPRHRWVDNIKMDVRDIGWGGMYLIDLAQDGGQWRALVNMVMNLQVPQNVWIFLSSCTTGSFSRRTYLHIVICQYSNKYIWSARDPSDQNFLCISHPSIYTACCADFSTLSLLIIFGEKRFIELLEFS
jgi:hypothetical protein